MLTLLTIWFCGGLFVPPWDAANAGKLSTTQAEYQSMDSEKTEFATFAGGCFWGTEYAYEHVPGVIKTAVGFMGGTVDAPSYKRVCAGDTMHAEVVHVEFDPQAISYRKLVEYFFKIHDPTTLNRQGPDAGTQYRSAIFFHNDEQKQCAEDIIRELAKKKVFRHPIVTQVLPAQTFWPAEDYHQQYFDKNPERAAQSCHIIPKFE